MMELLHNQTSLPISTSPRVIAYPRIPAASGVAARD